MAELADAQDLGSCGQAVGFKSLLPHFHLLVFFSLPLWEELD